MARAPRKKVLVVEDGGEVSLHGATRQGVFTDEQLAQVANMPEIKKVTALSRQPITKLPPFVAIEELRIGVLPALESLAGLEKMVTLRRVEFEQIDLYPDALARLRELPELVELTIIGGKLTKLPDGIAKLPSLLKLILHTRKPGFDYADACKQIARSKTIRHLELWATGLVVPDVLAPLKQLESIELELIAGKTKQIDLRGFTSLRRLTVRCDGAKLIGLDKTKVETLTLDRCAMPELDKLSIEKLDVIGMPDLDVNELALASIVELRVARTAKLDKKVFPCDAWTTSKILLGKMLTRER